MKIEMIGKRFGSYFVLKENGVSSDHTIRYYCLCDCGKYVTVSGKILRKKQPNCNHFKYHKLSKTKLYDVYMSMLARCYKTYFPQYKDYGGRGISVCDAWRGEKGFVTFYEWANNNGYNQGLQLDRIDNDGNYSPENCRFVTHFENSGIGAQRKQHNNKTGYVGVCFSSGKYRAFITYNKIRYELGYFKTIEEALQARIKKEIEIFGEQKTNINDKY